MTTKHTPGPWVVDDVGVICTDALERLVAAVDWRHVSLRSDEALANAHLIAAAPDLLEACETLARSFDAVAYAAWTPEMHAAVAAIAKAKGQKP